MWCVIVLLLRLSWCDCAGSRPTLIVLGLGFCGAGLPPVIEACAWTGLPMCLLCCLSVVLAQWVSQWVSQACRSFVVISWWVRTLFMVVNASPYRPLVLRNSTSCSEVQATVSIPLLVLLLTPLSPLLGHYYCHLYYYLHRYHFC